MLKSKLVGLLAFALISGSGQLVVASQERPYFGSASTCNSVAMAMGHGAHCTYVSVPPALVIQG